MKASRSQARVLSFFLLIAALAAFSSAAPASAQALQITTQPALYPAFDPGVSDYVTRCVTGAPIQVDVSSPAGTTIAVDGQGDRAGDFSAEAILVPGRSFRIVATSGSSVDTYFVRCLPPDFPAWTFQLSGQPQAQWYTVAPFARTDFQAIPPGVSRRYAAVFDALGVPIWWSKMPFEALNVALLPNSTITWNRQDTGGNEVRRLDGSLVRVIQASTATDAHDMVLLPNGDYVVQALRGRSGYDVCGRLNVGIGDQGIQEIAPDGSVVWEWWPSDHIPMSEIPAAWCNPILNNTANGYDVYHLNSVEPDGDGFILSFRHLDGVYRVSKADGSITWKLGGVSRPESLAVLNDPFGATDLFRGQHDPRVLADGSVTVHDNGYHADSQRPPRAVRYAIDLGARTATLVEQLNDPETIATPLCCGSARKLPGGDWLMAWGSAGVVTELSPFGARVFKLTFDDKLFTYRAQPVPFGEVSRSALREGMDTQYPRGFPRPRGTNPLHVPLVPAFRQCVSPDRTHGAPLSFGSCSSPAGTSSFLTVGTPDANGVSANSVGSVTFRAVIGDSTTPANEADVRLVAALTDVRWKSDLSDYTGELQLHTPLQITDRNNGAPEKSAATGFDTDTSATVPCIATTSDRTGATCSVSTSVNAIVPGMVLEGKRGNWGLGQVQVFDGGPSGTAGDSGATLFETQGLFVP